MFSFVKCKCTALLEYVERTPRLFGFGEVFISTHLGWSNNTYAYHTRFIPEGVAKASEVFLQYADVVQKWLMKLK
jgi:hypothetical protein